MADAELFSIGELARQAGVSRRTVRFYVQRGLIPEPSGRGRGKHYGPGHLAAVLRVKALQVEGFSLDEISHRIPAGEPRGPAPVTASPEPEVGPAPAPPAAKAPAPGQRWFRQQVLPGFELHIQEPHESLNEEQLTALAHFVHGLRSEGGHL